MHIECAHKLCLKMHLSMLHMLDLNLLNIIEVRDGQSESKEGNKDDPYK